MLYKRGNVYWCKWQISGQTVRETTGTPDRQAAQEWHDRRRAAIWRETRLGEQRIATWDEATISWVEEHAQHKKSYETDRLRLVAITHYFTGQPITAINTDALLALRKELLKDRQPATANRYLAVISAVIHHAHTKGLITAVPKIPYLPEPQERFRWLTREQAGALIAELPDHLAAMTRLALATGLRRANITGLIWQNIDPTRRLAWIWPDEAKSGKPIAVPLNNDALTVIKERFEQTDKDGNSIRDARYVFTWRGQPILHTTTKAWNNALSRAGIEPGFTFHDLRHTWASWHVMNGTPLEVLRQLCGWADMKMVLRYAHLAPGYVAGYAENSSLTVGTKMGTVLNVSEDYRGNGTDLGWLMGLEPTTTGITTQLRVKKAA